MDREKEMAKIDKKKERQMEIGKRKSVRGIFIALVSIIAKNYVLKIMVVHAPFASSPHG